MPPRICTGDPWGAGGAALGCVRVEWAFLGPLGLRRYAWEPSWAIRDGRPCRPGCAWEARERAAATPRRWCGGGTCE
eukprot:5849299-Pyramimonas_sp.AAC.1